MVKRVIFVKLQAVKRGKNAQTGSFRTEQVVNKVVKRKNWWSKGLFYEIVGGQKGYFRKIAGGQKEKQVVKRGISRNNGWSKGLF